MRRTIYLLAAGIFVLFGANGLHAQQMNSAESSLSFNSNTGKHFPLQAMAGELDPSMAIVEGTPGASYQIQFGDYRFGLVATQSTRRSNTNGTLHINPASVFLSFDGVLDTTGREVIIIPPNTFTEDDNVAVQARVGGVYSGATRFSVVRTMSSAPLLAMGNGSVANILGPITAISPSAISVGNLEYGLTTDTIFGNEPFENLQLGDWVDMVGEVTASGDLTAIEVNEEDADNEVRMRARIQGLGPSGFCLLNVSVYTSNATQFVDWETGATLAYSDLELAMPVEIRIPVGNEGFAFVSSIELNVEIEPEPEPEDETENEDLPPPFCS